jgi:hypothetical protein
MARYSRETEAYRNRERVQARPAPSEEEIRETREGYPERRREAIKAAIACLFRERPEYCERRAGQITCRLAFYLTPDFPRGPEGVPKDAEVAEILDGVAA